MRAEQAGLLRPDRPQKVHRVEPIARRAARHVAVQQHEHQCRQQAAQAQFAQPGARAGRAGQGCLQHRRTQNHGAEQKQIWMDQHRHGQQREQPAERHTGCGRTIPWCSICRHHGSHGQSQRHQQQELPKQIDVHHPKQPLRRHQRQQSHGDRRHQPVGAPRQPEPEQPVDRRQRLQYAAQRQPKPEQILGPSAHPSHQLRRHGEQGIAVRHRDAMARGPSQGWRAQQRPMPATPLIGQMPDQVGGQIPRRRREHTARPIKHRPGKRIKYPQQPHKRSSCITSHRLIETTHDAAWHRPKPAAIRAS